MQRNTNTCPKILASAAFHLESRNTKRTNCESKRRDCAQFSPSVAAGKWISLQTGVLAQHSGPDMCPFISCIPVAKCLSFNYSSYLSFNWFQTFGQQPWFCSPSSCCCLLWPSLDYTHERLRAPQTVRVRVKHSRWIHPPPPPPHHHHHHHTKLM